MEALQQQASIYVQHFFYSTLCCQTTPTMLGMSEYLGDVVCSSVAKAPHGSQRPKRQAGKQASKGNTHNNPTHHPKETRRQGRRQTPQPAVARGAEATPTPPHHPKPAQKGFHENFLAANIYIYIYICMYYIYIYGCVTRFV